MITWISIRDIEYP